MSGGVDDEAAFSAFVVARRPHLVFMARALLGAGRDDAEDIVQVALVRLAAHWSSAHDPHAYVRRVIVNLTVDRARRRRWLLSVGGGEELERQTVPSPDHAGEVSDSLTLRTALLALPARQRQVLTLRYLEGCSEGEAAALLGCSAGTVKNSAYKGLQNLRALVDHAEEADASQTGRSE